MDNTKTHAMYGMAEFGYTLSDVEIVDKPDTDGCIMTLMHFIDGYDDEKEIVIKTSDMASANRVKSGFEELSNMDYLTNADAEFDKDAEYYYAKVYNAHTDMTYQKILRHNGGGFICRMEEEVISCKPIDDSLYQEARIANYINESINAPMSFTFSLDYDYNNQEEAAS